jgi:hypothetical protein
MSIVFHGLHGDYVAASRLQLMGARAHNVRKVASPPRGRRPLKHITINFVMMINVIVT